MLTTTQLAGRERHRETLSEICREACSPETARTQCSVGVWFRARSRQGDPIPKCALCTPMTDTTDYNQHGKVRHSPTHTHGHATTSSSCPILSAPHSAWRYTCMQCTTRHGHQLQPHPLPFWNPVPAPPTPANFQSKTFRNTFGALSAFNAPQNAAARPPLPASAATRAPDDPLCGTRGPKGARNTVAQQYEASQ